MGGERWNGWEVRDGRVGGEGWEVRDGRVGGKGWVGGR